MIELPLFPPISLALWFCFLDIGLKSRDHLSENVRRMRQIQRKCKEREAASNQPVRPMWKSEKYKDVSSKIKTDIIEVCTTLLCISRQNALIQYEE